MLLDSRLLFKISTKFRRIQLETDLLYLTELKMTHRQVTHKRPFFEHIAVKNLRKINLIADHVCDH